MDASPNQGFSWKIAGAKVAQTLGIGAAVLLCAGALLVGGVTGISGIAVIEAEYRRIDEKLYTASSVMEPKNPVTCYEFSDGNAISPEYSRAGVTLPGGEKTQVLSNFGKGELGCPKTHFALRLESQTQN